VLISALLVSGSSKSNSSNLIEACSDLTTSLFRSDFSVTLNLMEIPLEGSSPTKLTSLFLFPQSSQENDPINISLKKGILVNMRIVCPLAPHEMHKLSTTIGSGFYLMLTTSGSWLADSVMFFVS
jgi:hypothetical protein